MRAFLKLTLEATGRCSVKILVYYIPMRKAEFAAGQVMRRRPIRGHALWDRDLAAARPFRTPGVSISSQTTERPIIRSTPRRSAETDAKK
jgi:hypothetical protein